jgi:hypothetical protein
VCFFQIEEENMIPKEVINKFAEELRKWWSFDDRQIHTHTWHSREDFIVEVLPGLFATAMSSQRGMEKLITRLEMLVADPRVSDELIGITVRNFFAEPVPLTEKQKQRVERLRNPLPPTTQK